MAKVLKGGREDFWRTISPGFRYHNTRNYEEKLKVF
jgi:hypothetical protein